MRACLWEKLVEWNPGHWEDTPPPPKELRLILNATACKIRPAPGRGPVSGHKKKLRTLPRKKNKDVRRRHQERLAPPTSTGGWERKTPEQIGGRWGRSCVVLVPERAHALEEADGTGARGKGITTCCGIENKNKEGEGKDIVSSLISPFKKRPVPAESALPAAVEGSPSTPPARKSSTDCRGTRGYFRGMEGALGRRDPSAKIAGGKLFILRGGDSQAGRVFGASAVAVLERKSLLSSSLWGTPHARGKLPLLHISKRLRNAWGIPLHHRETAGRMHQKSETSSRIQKMKNVRRRSTTGDSVPVCYLIKIGISRAAKAIICFMRGVQRRDPRGKRRSTAAVRSRQQSWAGT